METAMYIHIADGDLRDQISRLETQIEDLTRVIESCRKFILISKAAFVVGGIWTLAVVLEVVNIKPIFIIGAIAAMIFGIVGFGSNMSTLKQTTAAMKKAEALRDELINRIDLRVVGESEESRRN